MRRTWVYLVAFVGIILATGTGRLFAVLDTDDAPLLIPVDVRRENQPERFTVALGDILVFHAFAESESEPSPRPYGLPGTSPKPQAPVGDVELRVDGESGVLADMSAIRFANFYDGKLQLNYGGMKGRFVKAKKAGKVKVEVTTHRGGSRREIRDFEITVVEKRKQEIPVKSPDAQ
jgi:hypothetical protein